MLFERPTVNRTYLALLETMFAKKAIIRIRVSHRVAAVTYFNFDRQMLNLFLSRRILAHRDTENIPVGPHWIIRIGLPTSLSHEGLANITSYNQKKDHQIFFKSGWALIYNFLVSKNDPVRTCFISRNRRWTIVSFPSTLLTIHSSTTYGLIPFPITSVYSSSLTDLSPGYTLLLFRLFSRL